MVLFWGAVLFLIFRVARRRGPWGPWRQERSGHAVLAERYARGEIDADEYRERLGQLQEFDD
jgi:putative membrane protein